MKQLVNTILELDFKDISKANFPMNESFGLITYINNIKYEFLLHLKPQSNRLIVHGSGAIPPANKKIDRSRPFLNRWSWSDKFEDSIIYYNDPTLYLDDLIYGGYGVGTKDDYYLKHIADITLAIASNLNLENKNILFYGSSAGGFMTVLLSTMVKDSQGIADIPQFYLNELWGQLYWNQLMKHSFSGLDEKYVLENYAYRINAIEMMKKEKYIPNLILVLDCSVHRDFTMQYQHFFNDLNKLPFDKKANTIKIIINGKNEGHVPLDFTQTMFLIKESKKIFNDSLEIYDKNNLLISQEDLNELINLIDEFKLEIKNILDYSKELESKNNNLMHDLKNLTKENTELKETLNEIYGSKSWKYTKIFRK